MKLIKHSIIVCAVFSSIFLGIFIPGFAQEQLTITTYYPSPSGSFSAMRLAPRTDITPGGACTLEGQMVYIDDPHNQMYVCSGNPLQWRVVGYWTLAGSSLYTNDVNWNVGIGNTNPAHMLHVNRSNYGVIVLGNNTASQGFHITKESSDNSFNIWSGAIGTGVNRLKITRSGDMEFGIGAGNVGIGTANPAHMLHINRGNYGAIVLGNNTASQGFHITKESSDNSLNIWSGVIGAGVNRMRITSAGNVGIGTTNPASRLHVHGPAHWSGGLLVTSDPWSPEIAIAGVPNVSSIHWDHNGIYSYPSGDFVIQPRWRTGSLRLLLAPYAGNVGIGTTNPQARLHIAGSADGLRIDDVAYGGDTIEHVHLRLRRFGSNPNVVIRYDIAEIFEANEEVEPGDVLVLDEDGKLVRSKSAYDPKVVGIVSTLPAIVFEGSHLRAMPVPFAKGKKPPLALAGRVLCKVRAESEPIKIGDLLVTSSKPGYAMKGDPAKIRFGTVLGKALGSLDKGEGKIAVLATLQ